MPVFNPTWPPRSNSRRSTRAFVFAPQISKRVSRPSSKNEKLSSLENRENTLMRGKLRIGAINLRAAKICIIAAFLGAQFLGAGSLGARLPGAQAASPAGFRNAHLIEAWQAEPPALPDADNCVNCHTQSTGRAAEVVGIHQASSHGRAGVGCDDCHGGDPAQTEKAKAHSTNFTGKPDRNATLT